MNKQQQVIEWIVEKGEGYKVGTWERDDMVLSLNVSPATIYRALAVLRAEGSMDGSTYTGRQFVREIARFIDDDLGTLVTDKWYDRMSRELHTNHRALYASLVYALRCQELEQRQGGVFGWFLRRTNFAASAA